LPRLSIFQYWDSEEIPDYIAALLESVADSNPELEHRVFSESTAEELIAAHFGPRELACFRACALPAMQADYFRYCALLALGGVYVDADNRCVSSLWPLIEDDRSAHMFHGDRPLDLDGVELCGIQNRLLIFKQPRHPLMEIVLEAATLQIERRVGGSAASPAVGPNPGRMVWAVTGPAILTGLWFASQQQSLDAFLDRFAATRFDWLARTLAEAAGDSARLAHAFDRVGVSRLSECEAIRGAGIELPYKASDRHWFNSRSAIYRSPA